MISDSLDPYTPAKRCKRLSVIDLSDAMHLTAVEKRIEKNQTPCDAWDALPFDDQIV